MATLSTLDAVRTELLVKVGGKEVVLGPLCARLVLRTGVNLKSPRPEQANDPAVVGKVVASLGEMGYAL